MIHQRSRSISGKSLSKSILALFCAGLAFWPMDVTAQNANSNPDPDAGGTLGIDCEVPRRNDNGKIILDWDGTGRIACEADRNTALHWERLLKRLHGHVAGGIRKLEGENEDLTSFMDKLEQDDPVNLLVDGKRVYPEDPEPPGEFISWKDLVGAAACGDWKKVHILVWLEVPRDRWTAAMAQRAINAWHARLDPRRSKYQTPWRLMDGKLYRVDGYDRALPGCFEKGTPPQWPAGETDAWMAAVNSVSWSSGLEKEFDACPDGKFGRIEKTRRRVGGVYLDGDDKPIKKGSGFAGKEDSESWIETRKFCWGPDEGPDAVPDRKTVCRSKVTVPTGAGDRDNTECPVPVDLRKTCAERYPGFPRGKMVYRARKYSFPEDSGRDPVIGYHAENHCFDAELRTRQEVRNLVCPAGWAGLVKYTRNIRWWTFKPAPGSKARLWKNHTLKTAIKALADPPNKNNPPAFGTVSAEGWVPDRSHCRQIHVPTDPTSDRPRSPTCGWTCAQRGGREWRNSEGEECDRPKLPRCTRSNTGGNDRRTGDDTMGSYDTDGDGRTDSYSPSSTTDGYSTSGIGSSTGPGSHSGDGGKDD